MNRQKRSKSGRVQQMWFPALLLLCVLVLAPSVNAHAKWIKVGNNYRYTTNASGTKYYKKRWVKINGKYYYFNSKGYRTTGWFTYGGKKYYFNKKGVRLTGFQIIKNKKYYFNRKGVMLTGWLKYQNNYYYLNSKGVVQTGLKLIGSYVYYFDADGKRVSGANIVLGNQVYYFANNGTLQYTGTEEEKAAKYINVKRMLKGYQPLVYYTGTNLSNAAAKRAQELSVSASHTRPNGTGYSTVLVNDYPVSVYWSGECILWGRKKTGPAAAGRWLSDQNAKILLQKEANAFSIATYTDAQGCQYWVAIVVQTK